MVVQENLQETNPRAKQLVEQLADRLGVDEKCVSVKTVEKNGYLVDGVLIRENGAFVAPMLYLYDGWRSISAVSFDALVEDLAARYCEIRSSLPREVNVVCDLEHVFVKVVNYEKNKNALKDCPVKRISNTDLVATYRVIVEGLDEDNSLSSTLLTNKMLEELGVTEEKLWEGAIENTMRLFPEDVLNMDDVISSMCPWDEDTPSSPMLILTNSKKINGATAILYPGLLDRVREEKGDFYILPSSLNEVLLLPLGEMDGDGESLRELVGDVNTNVLPPEDFLSNEVFFYDGTLRVAA